MPNDTSQIGSDPQFHNFTTVSYVIAQFAKIIEMDIFIKNIHPEWWHLSLLSVKFEASFG